MDKSTGNSVHCDVGDRYNFWPPSEAVQTGENVAELVRVRQWADDSNVNVVESSRRLREGDWLRVRVSLGLAGLALAHIHAHLC